MPYVMDDSGEECLWRNDNRGARTRASASPLKWITSSKSRRSRTPPTRRRSSRARELLSRCPELLISETYISYRVLRETVFLRLAESYAWLNPHLSLTVKWHGKVRINIKASNPNWKKWLPSWPTSAHWYDVTRFRRYMAAHIANRGSITVREFISEFRGMTGTAKQKAVLAETGASHVSLHNFFGLHKANTKNIKKLLASLQAAHQPGAACRSRYHRARTFFCSYGSGGR